jgi:hypothetical protein
MEWHWGELFPRIGFLVTNSRLPAGKVTKVYNGRGNVESRIKKAKTLCVGTKPAGSDSKPSRPG